MITYNVSVKCQHAICIDYGVLKIVGQLWSAHMDMVLVG